MIEKRSFVRAASPFLAGGLACRGIFEGFEMYASQFVQTFVGKKSGMVRICEFQISWISSAYVAKRCSGVGKGGQDGGEETFTVLVDFWASFIAGVPNFAPFLGAFISSSEAPFEIRLAAWARLAQAQAREQSFRALASRKVL